MAIRALFVDLDNTIYPVSSIADHLFTDLFELMDKEQPDLDPRAKVEMTRTPYQWVADKYGFSGELKEKGKLLLKELTYDQPMQPFEDYHLIKRLPVDKFLVTTGFPNLQWSKIRMLGIENDFKSIHVVDPDVSSKMKKDIFQELMHQYHFQPDEVLVIGDDPESEIKAAKLLNIPTFLFDPANKYPNGTATYQSQRLSAAVELIN